MVRRAKDCWRAGFTLIEVVTTIFIIGLLMMLVLPNMNRIREFAQQKQRSALIHTLQTQVDLFRGEFPQQKVTLPDLKSKGYLTTEQLKQLEEQGVKLVGGRIEKNVP
ncbi:competence type IV pilus major pilin ComGC [Weissella halotolerans]|uniref:competence type IV pilus major pilin ComGC n=1 Tax=Weissella halotolerans TaxID=1615 RepID=UPI0003B6C814|nr:prepilin-type N-terminal cleavage/methylation domain-containing protein [Weissella halotolerans]